MNKTKFDDVFSKFETSIVSIELKNVAEHWREISGGKRIPARSNIDPSRIKAQLPIVWSYDYDCDEDDFVGRLAGLAITRISSKPFKGTKMSELRPLDKNPRSLIRAKRVVEEPALYRGYGLVYRTEEDVSFGERIMMPLANSADLKGAVFGATEYKSMKLHSSSLPQEREEIESWFSLAGIFPSLLAGNGLSNIR